MRKENIYLAIAKPFLKIGNYLMTKHVICLRQRQKKEGNKRL